MVADKGKCILIHLSSSSSDDGNGYEYGSCSDSASSASEEEYDSIDDKDEEEGDVFEPDDSEEEDVFEPDDSEEEEEEEEEEEDEEDYDSSDNGGQGVGDDNEDALYNRVIQYLQEKRDLRELSLNSCKAYLRRLGLRVSGNKDVCVKRAQEHWRIKDGKAEVLYPRSSFVINCTGDVCKGDVVLFTQKVYSSFDKVTRSGKVLGKRTVAGRVVKESYGAAKQQHTFTVEVLWCKGIKKLPPLFPLLVKGRNLYRLKTYRQPWKNEAERRKVLAEKHRRGSVARLNRAKRKRACPSDKGPSRMTCSKKGKCVGRGQNASSSKHSATNFNHQQPAMKLGSGAHTIKATRSKPFPRHKTRTFPEYRVSPLRSYYDDSHKYSQPPVGSYHRSMPLGSTSTEFQNAIPYHGPMMIPGALCNGFNYRPFLHNYDSRSSQMNNAKPWQYFPSKSVHGQRNHLLPCCSVQGCKESGSDKCVSAACQRCCRRKGMRCYVHR